MLRAIGLAVVLAALFSTSTSWGQQSYYHAGGGGYTQRIGNTSWENYPDGRVVTRTTFGGLHTYNDNRGGYGQIYTGPLGSSYSFGNTRTGKSTYNFVPRPIYTPPAYQPYRSPYGW